MTAAHRQPRLPGRLKRATMSATERRVRRNARVLRSVVKDWRAEPRFDAGRPPAQGLYDPLLEKDSCGVGFIANIKNRKSHQLVEDALALVLNLEHRGAVGADPRAGDGAGILVQIPHKFFAKAAAAVGIDLPAPGHYAVGYVFMPRDPEWRQVILDIYRDTVAKEGLTLLGWRNVPTDNASLGQMVLPTEPVHMQLFIGRPKEIASESEFERRL